MTRSATHRAALAYAAKGIAVFPIIAAGTYKQPATEHGLKDATTDLAQINAWWTDQPAHNIGIATGAAATFVVVDVDGPEGAASLAALEIQHGPLPETPEQTTARGRHICFAYDAERPIKNSQSRHARMVEKHGPDPRAKIDVRGDGGYIVAAPSKHASGVNYAWHAERRPSRMPFAPMPEWLRAVLEWKPPKLAAVPTPPAGPRPERAPAPAAGKLITPYGERALRDECDKIRTAQPGTQENTLNASAFVIGTLVGGGEISETVARAALVDAGMAIARDWTLTDVAQKVERALSQGQAQPRSAPPMAPRQAWRPAAPIAVTTEQPDAAVTSPHDPQVTDAQMRHVMRPIGLRAAVATEDGNPLGGLLEKIIGNPGAAFAPDVVSGLAQLMKEDRAAFETLRSQLKKAGCRVTIIDQAIAAENGETGGKRPTQADILIEIAQSADLFHTPDGSGYADIGINGHRETWSVRSRGFKDWMIRRFYETTGGAPSSEALQSAIGVIQARARFDTPERKVHIRVGGLDGRLYLDLGDETWCAVEIDAAGWRVIDNPPVRFRRAAGMQPLPAPVAGGSIDTLRAFLNVQSAGDFVLIVSWLLAAMRDHRTYPLLVLSGEQGSAKSTFSAIVRSLLDPNTAPLRAMPREDGDLFIAANNGHVLAFDNISALPAWISDTLCRLATGGGFAKRQLYTDQDEVLFDASRPVILNGIEDIVTRPDLADRAVLLTLEPIPEARRRPEAELWAAFEEARPSILGVLLDAMVEGIKRLPETTLPTLPRMADFALWATACETALWPAGTFMGAYGGNRDAAIEDVIDADPIATALRTLADRRTVWTGNASDLLGALVEVVGEKAAKAKTWPDSPRALSGRVRRMQTFLRKIGIEISYSREGKSRVRMIRVESFGPLPSVPSASSASSASSAPTAWERDDWTEADGADASWPAQSGQPSINNGWNADR